MRRFLVILLSVLCIALPLQAGARLAAADQHCPHMQDMHMQEMEPSPADSKGHHACCNDAATVAKTGQLCKTEHQCSPSLSYMLAPSEVQLAFTTQVQPLPATPVRADTGPPPAVWRPPTLI